MVVAASKIKANAYKSYFDKKSSKRTFKPNDELLLLLPDSSNKLLMKWRGPYKVAEVKSNLNFVIEMDGSLKTLHKNLLKK